MTSLNFTNLRVFIEEGTHSIYSELTKGSLDKAQDVPFVKMPDLFVMAACIGAKENEYKELASKKRDVFVADALNTDVQIPILIALAYKKLENLEEVSDPKRVLNVCEAYANGGIHIVYEQVLAGKGLRPLYRLTDFILEEAK